MGRCSIGLRKSADRKECGLTLFEYLLYNGGNGISKGRIRQLFESGKIDSLGIVSGVFPFDEAEAAMLRLIGHPEDECKVILKFDRSED